MFTRRSNNTNSKKINEISEKLNIIISDIKEIKQDIVVMKQDIVVMKQDIVVMKKDIVVMKKDIVNLRNDLDDLNNNFTKYKKQDANFQEMRNNNFIMNLLRRNKNTYNVTLLPIENIYMPYSKKILTEFDGLILYTPISKKMPVVSQELIDRVDKTFQESLKENISQINSLFINPQLIIVESKRSISKEKIDKKIVQFYEIITIFEELHTINRESSTKEFNTFINELKHHSNLDINDIQHLDLKMIFGSDEITPDMSKYITAIANGINRELYNELTFNMLKEDKYAMEYIEKLQQNKSIKLKPNYTYIDLMLSLYSDPDNMSRYIAPYFTDFKDLEHIFEEMRERIGLVQFNTAIFPQLFQYSSI